MIHFGRSGRVEYKLEDPSPFIIWTFRRSGGTNIANALFENSHYPSVEHEPFNLERVWGKVQIDWSKHQDKQRLIEEVDNILSKKCNIKHCLEIIPEEVNDAIVELSIKHGYKHLFLYREEAKFRLLSLNYSMKTNVWGKRHLVTRPFSENIFDQEIPISKLIKHEKSSRASMMKIYNKLLQRTEHVYAISFEQLYKSDFYYSSSLVKQLFSLLLGNDDIVTPEFLDATLRKGEQGTNSDYMRFPNSSEFVSELDKMNNFNIYDIKKFKFNIKSDIDICFMEFWKPLPSIIRDKFMLHGVVLSVDGYKLYIDGVSLDFKQDLLSNRVAKLFPHINKSKNCRFISSPISLSSNCDVLITSV